MKWLNLFSNINAVIFLLLTALYFYQFVYMGVGLYTKHKKYPKANKQLRYAIMICARNEENVIGDIIHSLKNQTYNKDKFDIFVLADNCTDHTYEKAIELGAYAYTRENTKEVGKGYALNTLYHNIQKDFGDNYDAYIVFDADNIIDKNFLTEMNNRFATGKYDALTSYRNSKNFCANWLTYGYSIWFLHEARLVNAARNAIGTTCMISGTGFLVSKELMKENGGWPYHLLTEDIEFSVNCALKGKKIGYVDKAIVYDEQPTSWAQSYNQRMRWSKGFLEINQKYFGSLISGLFTSNHKLGIYDVLMTVAPCTLLTLSLLFLSVFFGVVSYSMPKIIAEIIWSRICRFIVWTIVVYYVLFLFMGLVTLVSEWKNISGNPVKKVLYLAVFPLFLFTYAPITIIALFKPVEWTPIAHHSTRELLKSTK